MFTKPCARPGCTQVIAKAQARRLADAKYCSRACGARHRVEMGGHPFHLRTPEQRHRNAVIGGRTRAQRAKRRKLRSLGDRFAALFPPRWELTLDREDVARIKALIVRAYREGHDDGYQAGHTANWRARNGRKPVAA